MRQVWNQSVTTGWAQGSQKVSTTGKVEEGSCGHENTCRETRGSPAEIWMFQNTRKISSTPAMNDRSVQESGGWWCLQWVKSEVRISAQWLWCSCEDDRCAKRDLAPLQIWPSWIKEGKKGGEKARRKWFIKLLSYSVWDPLFAFRNATLVPLKTLWKLFLCSCGLLEMHQHL